MKNIILSALIAVSVPAIAAAAASTHHGKVAHTSNHMHNTYKGIVTDGHGGMVRDGHGGCVRTQWDEPTDRCGLSSHCDMHRLAVIFFDFDKSHLRNDAYKTVKNVYTDIKKHGGVKHGLAVVGHTDTMGTLKYNQALSERRARSVKSKLVEMGIPSKEIHTSGKSFTEPLVETGPNVPEQKNRRAEVFYTTK